MMHHHHSPVVRLLGSISWLVTALSSLAVGLAALGNSMNKNWNIWDQDFVVANLGWLVQPALYVIGVCGLFSLLCWFMCLGKCDDRKK
jgi:hypothetical protein